MKTVRIIGGGPAGSAAAIHLARAGLRVTLYEKIAFPRPKLCGGFLSAEALPELASLGVKHALMQAGAQSIERVVLTASSGHEADVPLARLAWAVSRRRLDSLLLQEARDSGAAIVQGDGFCANDQADWTIDATGRRPSPDGAGRACGIQAYFAGVRGVSNQVELHLFPGGYVGLARHEDGTTNLCASLQREIFQQRGPDLDTLLESLSDSHYALSRRMKTARRCSPWLATGPATLGFRQLMSENRFFVGDSACAVDPFAGEGLTLSLIGARLLAKALLTDTPSSYVSEWHRAFDHPLALQKLLRLLSGVGALQELLVRGAGAFPPALSWLDVHTRAPQAMIA